MDNTPIDTNHHWRKIGEDDRSRSVNDFLFTIRSVVEPLDILCEQLEGVKPKDGSITLTFDARREAQIAQMRLRLLLADGDAIAVNRVEAFSSGNVTYRLTLPKKLVSDIRRHIAQLDHAACEIADRLEAGDRVQARLLRGELTQQLKDRGLIVHLAPDLVEDILQAYDALPHLHGAAALYPSRAHLIPLIKHCIIESASGTIGAPTPQERAFVSALVVLANDIFAQRHMVGKSTEPHSNSRFFPDDFVALLQGQLEQRWDYTRTLTVPANPAVVVPGGVKLPPDLYTGAAQPQLPPVPVVTTMNLSPVRIAALDLAPPKGSRRH